MDLEDTKQIIIGYNAINDSCKAMLKPVKIELGDTETVAKLPKDAYDTYEWIKTDCKAIQTVLTRMENYIDDLKESIYNDGEIDESRKMISDILFDVQPVPNKIPSQPAFKEMDTIAKLSGYPDVNTVETVEKNIWGTEEINLR